MAIASYEKKGDLIDYTNATKADIAYHQVLVIGSVVGVATESIAIGETGSVAIVGVFGLPTAATIKAGAAVYWDTKTDAAVAETSTTAVCAGIATADSANGVVSVKLDAGK